MPGEKRSSSRTRSMERTRTRILETAREVLPGSADLPVDEIASRAEVSVQTLYTHFGSKRGLVLAVIDSLQRDIGLYADFDTVWSSPDGETALRRMLAATFQLWHRGWPLVAFIERVRRTDEEIGRVMLEVDGYRRSNLVTITTRLSEEGRLTSLDIGESADLAFSMSLPSVYEELVVRRGWPLERAFTEISRVVVGALIDPRSVAVVDPVADWSAAARPAPRGDGVVPREGGAPTDD